MTDNAPKPPPDKTLRWLIGIIVAVVVLVGGYAFYRWAVRRGVEKRFAAIRAAGQPVTLKELDEWYPTPPVGLNGVDVYQRAFFAYSNTGGDNENLPVVNRAALPELGEPIQPEMLSAIRVYLAANDEALKLLHEAAAYEECRFSINMSPGPGMLMPHLAKLRHAARILYLEAILKTEDGDAEGAVQAVSDSLAVGNSLRNEPILISHLVQIACDSLSRASFERILSRTELTDAQLVSLRDAFRKAEAPEGMTRAFVGERCQGIARFESTATPSAMVLKLMGLADMEAKEYMDIMNIYIASAQASSTERQELSREITKRIHELPRWCVFSAMFLPALDRSIYEDSYDSARLRCAATAAVVERYRLANGRFPGQLSDITPEYIAEIPTDPFTASPLLYKMTDEGCVIYSVGQDGKDDGGIEFETDADGRRKSARLDLPFRLLKRQPPVEK